jgi:hypothetical protein
MLEDTCPWCQAPRAEGPSCPRCGANYAKAAMIKMQGRAGVHVAPAAAAAPAVTTVVTPAMMELEQPDVEDPELEWKFCLAAIPAALLLALVFNAWVPFVQRILTMPVHELGHAVAAWFCGYAAIPTPLWVTYTPESRGFVAPVLLFGALAYMAWRAWRVEVWPLVGAAGALFLLQLYCTFGIREKTAQMLITFGGDAMGMVLGTALMASFFFGKKTNLYKGSLRWGFVCIGAAAYVDMFGTWVRARYDTARIPFGEQERAGPSDASKLTDVYGWTDVELVRRHLLVGAVCLLALAAVYAWGVWQARKEAEKRAAAA